MDAEEGIAWVQGTHEYRPLGTAALSRLGQFRRKDFRQDLRRPQSLDGCFVGFFGSLETVNAYLESERTPVFRRTPAHLV